MRAVFALTAFAALVAASSGETLGNGKVTATVTAAGLVSIAPNEERLAATGVKISNDSFSVAITGSQPSAMVLSPATCSTPTVAAVGPMNVTLTYTCNASGFTVAAQYFLMTAASNYVSKILTITGPSAKTTCVPPRPRVCPLLRFLFLVGGTAGGDACA